MTNASLHNLLPSDLCSSSLSSRRGFPAFPFLAHCFSHTTISPWENSFLETVLHVTRSLLQFTPLPKLPTHTENYLGNISTCIPLRHLKRKLLTFSFVKPYFNNYDNMGLIKSKLYDIEYIMILAPTHLQTYFLSLPPFIIFCFQPTLSPQLCSACLEYIALMQLILYSADNTHL